MPSEEKLLNSEMGLELGIDTLPRCDLRISSGPPITARFAQYWLQTRGVKGASALLGISSTALGRRRKEKREVLCSVSSISNGRKKKEKKQTWACRYCYCFANNRFGPLQEMTIISRCSSAYCINCSIERRCKTPVSKRTLLTGGHGESESDRELLFTSISAECLFLRKLLNRPCSPVMETGEDKANVADGLYRCNAIRLMYASRGPIDSIPCPQEKENSSGPSTPISAAATTKLRPVAPCSQPLRPRGGTPALEWPVLPDFRIFHDNVASGARRCKRSRRKHSTIVKSPR
ncbi:hypothetical protein GGI35DRAFT_274768 [Trichoderma velutinum]